MRSASGSRATSAKSSGISPSCASASESRGTARRAERHEIRKAIEVSLHGVATDDAKSGTIELSYAVRAARWAPTYVLRQSADLDRATLEARAMVRQQSGENWEGVELSLSTADLHAWAELPELTSLRIGRAQPRPVRAGWRPPPVGVDALFGDFDRARPPGVPKSTPVAAAPAKAMPDLAEEDDLSEILADEVMLADPEGMVGGAVPMPQGMLRASMEVAASTAAPPAPAAPALEGRAFAKRKRASRGMSMSFGSGGGGLPPTASALMHEPPEEPIEEEPDWTATGDLLRYGQLSDAFGRRTEPGPATVRIDARVPQRRCPGDERAG